jgi:hypothetical protein
VKFLKKGSELRLEKLATHVSLKYFLAVAIFHYFSSKHFFFKTTPTSPLNRGENKQKYNLKSYIFQVQT